MNAKQYEQVKSAAEAIDVGVVQSVYPSAFLERWAQHGMEMPKSAAELDVLLGAAYDVSKAKAAQYHQSGGVRSSSQIARVADMAKRAAIESGVSSPVTGGNYDLSGVAQIVNALIA